MDAEVTKRIEIAKANNPHLLNVIEYIANHPEDDLSRVMFMPAYGSIVARKIYQFIYNGIENYQPFGKIEFND